MIEFKGSHVERDMILWAVRWYVAYPISDRQREEMMTEHGVEVDHATLNRWVVNYVPLLEKELRARKQPVGPSWRMDETFVKVKATWTYLYRGCQSRGHGGFSADRQARSQGRAAVSAQGHPGTRHA